MSQVVMLTASKEEDAVIEAVAVGAAGYLQKVLGMERLLATLRVPAEVVRRVLAKTRRGAGACPTPG